MRKVLLLALAASGALSLLSLAGHPYTYLDQATQLTNIQAWTQGKTPFPNWINSADPADLARDHLEWDIWHPPGFPLLLAPLIRLGLTYGAAIQLLAIPCFIAGCIGWSLWALHFKLPRPLHLALPLLIPGIRYGNDNLIHFHAEAFLFAATPWLLLATLHLLRAKHVSPLHILALGLALGSVYLLKYSGLFLIAGLLAGLILSRKKSWETWLPLALLAALPILTLSLINRHWGAAENLVTASWHFHLSPTALLFLTGSIPLALADGGQIFDAVLLNPSYGLYPYPNLVPCLGLPGAIFLLYALSQKKAWSDPDRLALHLALVSMGMLLIVWTLCDGVDYERRYLIPAALALLPLTLSAIWPLLQDRSRPLKILAALFLLGYLAVPVLYGYATFALKALASARYTPAASGLNTLLTDRDGAGTNALLNAQSNASAHDLWYLPETILALDLQGRHLFGHPTWDPTHTDEPIYHTSQPQHLLALAPAHLPDQAVTTYLTQIFPQATTWTKQPLPQANYTLWITDLK